MTGISQSDTRHFATDSSLLETVGGGLQVGC